MDSSKTTNKAFVYLFYTKKPDLIPVPVLEAIATTRSFCNDNIYIFDYSKINWGTWPSYLNFKVIPIKKKLNNFPKFNHNPWMLSKPWDVYEYSLDLPEDEIIHCDTDLFWIKDPFPLLGNTDYLCSSWNTGLFYFNKKSQRVKQAFELWFAYTLLAIKDIELTKKMFEMFDYDSKHLQEEIIFRYIQDKLIKLDLSQDIEEVENFSIDVEKGRVFPYRRFRDNIKALHIRTNNKNEACQELIQIRRRIELVDKDNLLINRPARYSMPKIFSLI